MNYQDKYQYALDQTSIFAITDHAGVITYVNDKFCKISKYSRDELLGKTHNIINSNFHSRKFWSDFWKKISSGKIWRGEIRNRAKDGTFYWVDTTVVPYVNDDGKVEKYFAIRNDITDKKDLEDKVIHQDRLAAVGLMASGLAHEIGTPLGVIRGRAEFLQMNSDDEIQKKNLDIIIAQTDRVSRLITTLLRLSRTGEDIKIQPLRIEEIVEEVIVLLEEKFKRRDINIIKNFVATRQILGDRYRVEQVLMNLIINAFQAIEMDKNRDKKHNIEITTDDKHNGTKDYNDDFGKNEIEIHTRIIDDQKVELKIRDSGCGISESERKKIFEPFFTTKEVGSGTGLGLTIVAKLLHEINAHIRVESKVGVGTTFYILFPAAP